MPSNPLIPRKEKAEFVDVKHSAGILDDFAVRKTVATLQGTIETAPVNPSDIVNKAYVDSQITGITGSPTAFGLVPIGAVIFWAGSMSGVPSLPENFQLCNASAITDVRSPMYGGTTPPINSIPRFIRANTTSGSTGGSATHNHTFTGTAGTTGTQSLSGSNVLASGSAVQATHTHSFTPAGTISTDSNLPPYIEMIAIIRIW